MSAVLQLIRAVRFRVWALVVRARLRRLGGDLRLDAAGAPRLRGWPHVDIDGHPGVLTLRLGRDVRIGRDLVLDLASGVDGVVALGDRVTLQDGVRLQPWGGTIQVDEGAQVRDHCELKSTGDLRLGAGCVLSRSATIHCHERITIGEHCPIAERTTIIDSDHSFAQAGTPILSQPVRSTPISIGSHVFIGTNTVILRGAVVGDRAVIAAGSVLNGGEYPAAHIVAGVPAKTVRALG